MCIMLSLHNYNMKWPNFGLMREQEQQGDKFYFPLQSDEVSLVLT